MDVSSSFNEMRILLAGLTDNQKARLVMKYSKAYMNNFVNDLITEIAVEAKTRVQSKIATYFTGGYATGALFDSIYYTIEGMDIQVKSTKSYFAILNEGFGPFDMKEALMGKTVRMRLPGGRVIFRKVGDQNEQESSQRKNLIVGPIRNKAFLTKKNALRKNYTTKNWIHPGVQGKHIFEMVEEEMRPWISDFVRDKFKSLLLTVPDVPFHETQEGYIYYSRRDKRGRFRK